MVAAANQYKPPQQNQVHFIEQISQLLNRLPGFENVLVLGGFNMKPNNQNLCSLSEEHDLKNFIMKTQLFETGFSDHYHLIYTIFQQGSSKKNGL